MSGESLPPSAFEALCKQVLDPLCIGSFDGSILWVNPAFEKLLGYSSQEFIGRQVYDQIHPDDLQVATTEHKKLLETGEDLVQFRMRYRHKEGNYLTTDWTARADFTEQRFYCSLRDITEEVESQKSQEAYWARLFKATPGIRHALDKEGKIELVSKDWLDKFGYEEEEVIGRTSVSFLTPESQEQFKKIPLTECEKIDGAGSRPLQFLAKNGQVVDIELSAIIEPSTSSTPKRFLANLIDVSCRKKAEIEAAEAQQHLQTIADRHQRTTEVLRHGIFEWDLTQHAESQRTWISSSYLRMLGYTDATEGKEITPAFWETHLHQEDAHKVAEAFAEFMPRLPRDELLELEYRLIKLDGTPFKILQRSGLIFDAAGNPTYMVGVIEDISALKISLEQQERLVNVLDASSDYIGMATIDGVPFYSNRTMADYIGDRKHISECHPPWAYEAIRAGVQEAIEKGRWRGETALLAPDGAEIPMDQLILAPQKEGQSINYTATVIRDISQAKELEETLRHKNQELETFAYMASHDLQEPLRTITGFVKILNQKIDKKLSEEEKKYFYYVEDGTQRMQALIQDLLSYARIGRSNEGIQQIDLSDILEGVVGTLSAAIDDSQAQIQIGPMPTIAGYPTQLNQLFQNLVSNALKFRSDVPPLIEIKAEERKDSCLIRVKDNGIGIKPEHSARIFQPFRRLNHRNKYPGTGIGLAIVKKVAQEHNGDVSVHSEPGEGTTFEVCLSKRVEHSVEAK